jgi:hypothetical protein
VGNTVDVANWLRHLSRDHGPYSVTPRSEKVAIDAIGVDSILFGSEYGPMPSSQPVLDTLDTMRSPYDRERI